MPISEALPSSKPMEPCNNGLMSAVSVEVRDAQQDVPGEKDFAGHSQQPELPAEPLTLPSCGPSMSPFGRIVCDPERAVPFSGRPSLSLQVRSQKRSLAC